MSDKARIRIAAVATALFLAALCTAGFLLRDHPPQAASAAAPAAAATPASAGQQLSDDSFDSERGAGAEQDD